MILTSLIDKTMSANTREVIKAKLREHFGGKVVRKDLTKKIKEGANVPVYVLEFLLGEQGSVIARPSGTEPKVKFYYTAVAPTAKEAKALLDAMVQQMSK